MSKNNSAGQTSLTTQPEVYYVAHENHLHDFETESEAELAEQIFHGGKVWAGGELVFALEEVIRLRKLAVAVTELLIQHSDSVDPAGQGDCNCRTCSALRPLIIEIALGVVDAVKSGRLDSGLSDEKKELLARQIGIHDLITQVQQALSNYAGVVRVVASRAKEGQKGIEPLIGQEFEVVAINPVTQEVQIIAPPGYENGGPVILSPDEYVFVNETATAAPAEE